MNDKELTATAQMIFRFVSKDFVIVTGHKMDNNFKIGNDFKFNIQLKKLAVTPGILRPLGLFSMYAESHKSKTRMGNPLIAAAFGYTEPPSTEDEAVQFFTAYLNGFLKNEPTLKENDMLSIMVTNQNMQQKLFDYFSNFN